MLTRPRLLAFLATVAAFGASAIAQTTTAPPDLPAIALPVAPDSIAEQVQSQGGSMYLYIISIGLGFAILVGLYRRFRGMVS